MFLREGMAGEAAEGAVLGDSRGDKEQKKRPSPKSGFSQEGPGPLGEPVGRGKTGRTGPEPREGRGFSLRRLWKACLYFPFGDGIMGQ